MNSDVMDALSPSEISASVVVVVCGGGGRRRWGGGVSNRSVRHMGQVSRSMSQEVIQERPITMSWHLHFRWVTVMGSLQRISSSSSFEEVGNQGSRQMSVVVC